MLIGQSPLILGLQLQAFANLDSSFQLLHVIQSDGCHESNDNPFKIPTQLRLQVVNQILLGKDMFWVNISQRSNCENVL